MLAHDPNATHWEWQSRFETYAKKRLQKAIRFCSTRLVDRQDHPALETAQALSKLRDKRFDATFFTVYREMLLYLECLLREDKAHDDLIEKDFQAVAVRH